MKKNSLLNIAILGCKATRIILFAVFIFLTGVLIHFLLNPGFYDTVNIDFNAANYSFTSWDSWSNKSTNEDFILQRLTHYSVVLGYIQYITILFVFFFISKEFQKIIQSVKSLNSFQLQNISSFRRIGKYLFLYFLLDSFHIFFFEEASFIGINISLGTITLILFNFILAEIFKEGNFIKQENDLTI